MTTPSDPARIDPPLAVLAAVVREAIAEHEQNAHVTSADVELLRALADIVAGPEVFDPFTGGSGRRREDGLDRRMARMEAEVRGLRDTVRQVVDEGVRVRIPWTVWAALITAVATIVAAVLGGG